MLWQRHQQMVLRKSVNAHASPARKKIEYILFMESREKTSMLWKTRLTALLLLIQPLKERLHKLSLLPLTHWQLSLSTEGARARQNWKPLRLPKRLPSKCSRKQWRQQIILLSYQPKMQIIQTMLKAQQSRLLFLRKKLWLQLWQAMSSQPKKLLYLTTRRQRFLRRSLLPTVRAMTTVSWLPCSRLRWMLTTRTVLLQNQKKTILQSQL